MRTLSDEEKYFIELTKNIFIKENKEYIVKYDIMSGNVINFRINDAQIGRIKLKGKPKMQIMFEKKYSDKDIDKLKKIAASNKFPTSEFFIYKENNKISDFKWIEDEDFSFYVSMIYEWLNFVVNSVYNLKIESKLQKMPMYINPFTNEVVIL